MQIGQTRLYKDKVERQRAGCFKLLIFKAALLAAARLRLSFVGFREGCKDKVGREGGLEPVTVWRWRARLHEERLADGGGKARRKTESEKARKQKKLATTKERHERKWRRGSGYKNDGQKDRGRALV